MRGEMLLVRRNLVCKVRNILTKPRQHTGSIMLSRDHISPQAYREGITEGKAQRIQSIRVTPLYAAPHA